MAQGICDTPVPDLVAEAAGAAMREGHNTYSRYDGSEELRQALGSHMKSFNGLDYDPDGEIVVTIGATGAFHIACTSLLEPGDEVLLFEPFYGYHVATLRSENLVPVPVELEAPDWSIDPAKLEGAVTARTKAIVINTPSNPCGKVFSREELLLLADFAASHDLWVFTDEVYEHFVFDGREHVAPASLPGMRERTITMSSLSKTFAITGWRLGWMAADAKWGKAFGQLNDLVYVCAPTPLQIAAAQGLNDLGTDYFRELGADHERKRDQFCAALSDVGLTPMVPQGAYYVLADASSLWGGSGLERALHLLERTGIASVPGEAFFDGGKGGDLLRFCFGKTDEDLTRACAQLQRLS